MKVKQLLCEGGILLTPQDMIRFLRTVASVPPTLTSAPPPAPTVELESEAVVVGVEMTTEMAGLYNFFHLCTKVVLVQALFL